MYMHKDPSKVLEEMLHKHPDHGNHAHQLHSYIATEFKSMFYLFSTF